MTRDTPTQDAGTGPDRRPRWPVPSGLPEIPGYRVEGLVGAGGFSLVFRAYHLDSAQHRAVKIMKRGLFAGETRDLLMQEFRRMVRLPAHPGVVRVYDPGLCAGAWAGEPYLPMELVEDALPIDRFIAERGLTGWNILRLFTRVCEAVEAVHRAGFLHRDLKPGNILVTSDGRPKVVDFGIAQRLLHERPSVAATDLALNATAMTLQYASPEQLEGRPDLGQASDIHALGVILFGLLSGGRFPFEFQGAGRSTEDWKRAILSPRRVRLRLRGDRRADALLVRVVARAVARDPDRRYASAGQFARALRRHHLLTSPLVAFRGSGWVIVVASAAVVAMFLTRWVGVPLVYRWTDAHFRYERLLMTKMPQPVAPGVMSTVRMVVVDDETDWEAIAEGAGLEGARNDNVYSTRRVWGWFLERLAESGAKPLAVVFDLTFREVPAAAEFSESLARGVRRISGAGVPVAVGLRDWPRPGNDEPNIAEPLKGWVAWGGTTLDIAKGELNWSVHLALIPAGAAKPLPGLSLTALALARRPGHVPRIELDATSLHLTLRFDAEARRAWLSAHETAPLRVRATDMNEVGPGVVHAFDSPVMRGDIAARLVVAMPDDDVMRDAAVSIQRAALADPERLRLWFDGRVVVAGNARSSAPDRYEFVGRGVRPGVEGHALAIDSLLREQAWRVPNRLQRDWLALAAGATGAAVLVLRVRRIGRIALVLAAGALWCAASIGWYYRGGVVIDPWLQVFAVLIGAVSAWAAKGQLQSLQLLRERMVSA